MIAQDLALWEDNKTTSKWVIVNRCYLPGELPEVVGCPCTPEYNEVYESNHDSTVMAGLIQGPCEVLPPNKFKDESERRIHLGHEANDGLQPVFLCKYVSPFIRFYYKRLAATAFLGKMHNMKKISCA
ncbi:hypothetical protein HHK36_003339 [Tetracentron sinense]|uniref:BAH domain-containing protein n=1 Tax=Tetracentron sinense TaxID=13715 RepID=A0A834ZQZ6_TETSI|nr:hypothetical protein HHK36_003339 [Tetracentron sinense]